MIAEVAAWPMHSLVDNDQSYGEESRNSQAVLQALLSRQHMATLIRNLDNLLEENGIGGNAPSEVHGDRIQVGTYDTYLEPREIHRGILMPVLRRPIIDEVIPERVVYYLTIAGEDDILIRERGGGIGYHYHYAQNASRRSDLLIAWDTRATCDNDVRGLFGERHAVKGKFNARPATWKAEKRTSVHLACKPDLAKWPMDAFRNASDEALPVWPPNAVLTPRAAPPEKAIRNSNRKRDKRG